MEGEKGGVMRSSSLEVNETAGVSMLPDCIIDEDWVGSLS